LKRKFWKIADALKFFRVPEARVQSIYCKLAMRVFDVYVNILKYMYITRFDGGPTRSEASPKVQPTPIVVTPLIRTMVTFHADKYRQRKKSVRQKAQSDHHDQDDEPDAISL
jgi:hypothetical protein